MNCFAKLFFFMLLMLFQTAAAITEIYFGFSLHQKLNWRDGRLIISDSDCCLISDGDSNQ